MRWKNLIILVVITTITSLFLFIFISPLVKMGIEKAATAAVGAKVEFGSLKVKLHKLEITGLDLQVTNPEDTMSNIVRIGKIAFKMDLFALLEAKYVVDLIALEDLRIGTPRKSDGAIKKKKKKAPKSGDKKSFDVEKMAEKFNIFDVDLEKMKDELDIDRYISGDLKTIKEAERLKEEAEKLGLKWKDEFTDMSYYNDVMAIADDIRNFDPSISNPAEAPAKIARIVETKQKVERIVNDLQAKKGEFERDFVDMTNNVKRLEEVSREELNELLAKLNLGEISLDSIGDMIFKDEFNRNLDKALYWFYLVRPYIPAGGGVKKNKTVKAEKREERQFGSGGYDVSFPITKGYPAFHIRKISLSSSGKESAFPNYPTVKGTISDIVSDQNVINRPLAINLKVILPEFHQLESSVNVSFDRRGGKMLDSYRLGLKKIPLDNIELSGGNGLPGKLDNSALFVTGAVTIDSSYTEVVTDLSLRDIRFSYDESQNLNQFGNIVKDIISSVEQVDFKVRVRIEEEKREFEIKSNLDRIFAGAMEKLFRETLSEVKTEFENRFNERIAAGREELTGKMEEGKSQALALYREQEKKINSQLRVVENRLNELESEVNRYRSELENKAQEELQKQLESVTDKLPNLF